MEFENFFPFWDQLSETHRNLLCNTKIPQKVAPGTVLHSGSADCAGLFLIRSGRLRAYILSEEGREITLYRLFERDICLLSAPCIMRSIQFDVIIEAEKETDLWVIPPHVYREMMASCAAVANYTNELMATRFSDVMWLMEQILWKSLDRRLADFLLEESALEGTESLKITHEGIANHLGSPREVITRMLNYFRDEGVVRLSRGTVMLTDLQKLNNLRQK